MRELFIVISLQVLLVQGLTRGLDSALRYADTLQRRTPYNSMDELVTEYQSRTRRLRVWQNCEAPLSRNEIINYRDSLNLPESLRATYQRAWLGSAVQ